MSPKEFVAHADLMRLVRAAMANLPEMERALVERCDLEERSVEEAGAAVGLSRP